MTTALFLSQVPSEESAYFRRVSAKAFREFAILEGTFQPACTNDKAEELLGLVRAGEVHRAIDELFDVSQKLRRSNRFDYLDSILSDLSDAASTSLEFSIAALTASLPVRSKLSKRDKLLKAVEHALVDQGKSPSAVLVGLR